eukprot:3543720-Rhodomonas_salina.2
MRDFVFRAHHPSCAQCLNTTLKPASVPPSPDILASFLPPSLRSPYLFPSYISPSHVVPSSLRTSGAEQRRQAQSLRRLPREPRDVPTQAVRDAWH